MAEREIKTKIVLEGEQQFRQAMNNASASVKALNAEEKAAEAQFKATGDAEAYREEKTRILTEKLEEQKKAVEAAKKAVEELTKKGVEKNDKAMQQWRTKLANAQTALAQTQSKLQGLQGGLENTSQAMDNASQAAADYSAQLDAIGGVINVEGAIKSIDRITDTVSSAVKTVAGLGKKVWDLEADAASWADELITNAQKAGIDVVTYQAWEYAAQMVDTSIDDILSAQTRMNQKLLKESPEVAAAIGNIGVSFSDNAGNQRASEDIFWDTIRALNAMDDITERNNKAQQIFGNNYRNLLPLINKGADAWEEYAKEGADNYALNEDQIGKLGDLDDALVKLGASLDKTKMTILAELAPTFSELAGAMAEAVGAFNDFLATKEGQQMIQALGDAIGELAMAFLDPGPDGFKNAVNTAKTLLNGVTDALKWLKENKGNVKTALGVIAGGFVVFETAKGLLNIIEAGKSLRTIFSSKSKLTGGSGSGTDTGLPGLNSGNGGGTGAGIGTQTVTTQTVTTQTVTTENVTNENVTSENVTTQNVTSQAVTTDNTTTSNVGTMYVQTMVGGNGTPTNQTNPATPPVTSPSTPSGGGLPSGSSFPGLPSGSGQPLNGAIPLLNPAGGSGLNLPSGADVNISSGNPTVNISGGNPTLNLPSGSSTPNLPSGGGTPAGEPIKLDPSEFNVSGPGQSGQPQLRWPEETPNKKVNPNPDGGGGFGWAAAAFAAWGAALYGAVTGLDHLLGDAERAKDIEARESNLEKAEEAAAALGPELQDDVDTLTRAVNALGPAVDEQTGEYKLNPFFSTYWEPTDDLGAILGDLGDWRKRGLLYADIQKYGPRDGLGDTTVPGTGFTAWDLLRRYWGVYTEGTRYGSEFPWIEGENAGDKRVDYPLDQQEVYALIQYIRDMYMNKLMTMMQDSGSAEEAGAEAGESFGNGAEGAGTEFAGALIREINANMSAVSAAAESMGRVMRQGVISGAAGGVAAGLLGSMGGVVGSGVSGSGLSARIYMDKQVVGAMVADTVNEVMGSRINNSRR